MNRWDAFAEGSNGFVFYNGLSGCFWYILFSMLRVNLIVPVFLICFCLLCVSHLAAAALPPAPAVDIQNLDRQFLREPAQFQITAQDMSVESLPLNEFRPLTAQAVNQGISDRAFWIRVRLRNKGDQPAPWVLRHETSYLDHLTAYFADNGGAIETLRLSDREPYSVRPLDYRALGFRHTTPAQGYTDLYLRLAYDKADSISLNLMLSSPEAFEADSRSQYISYGLYYGAMLTLVFVSLVGAWLLREWLYFTYGVFLIANGLMWALLNGFAFQYLWPTSVFWHNEGFHIVYLLMAASAFQFSRGFLHTHEQFPRVDRLIKAMQLIMLGGIVLRFFGVYGPVLVLSFVSLISLVLLAPLGFMAYRRGQRYARWYALAWVVYGIGLGISVVSASSTWLSWGMEPLVFAQAAGVLEAVLLLVALGERLSGWDRDRRLALRMAHQDELTGLNNRRGLRQAYQSFRERYGRDGRPVFIILIDLDHFKSVNDTFGHEAGDRVLIDLAQLLLRSSRSDDVCIRYGGEEFIVMLQAPDDEVAVAIAERIRKEFAREPTDYEGKTIPHTLTAGLATVFSKDVYLSAQEMVQHADVALYDAKRAGRNRCSFYARSGSLAVTADSL